MVFSLPFDEDALLLKVLISLFNLSFYDLSKATVCSDPELDSLFSDAFSI